MAFNKKDVLINNIDAIEIVLSGRTIGEAERNILREYKSFGGIKSVLLNPETPDLFPQADKNLIPLVARLHDVLQKYSKDEQESQKYLNSVKNSIMTSFYTPSCITEVINDILSEEKIRIDKMLDPSAGAGAFLSINATSYVAVEKDILTGKILKALNPEKNILIHPFEQISRSYENTFDLVTSNIPFGKLRVFDPIFLQNKRDKVKIQATETIHNYFFLKGVDMLREGGVMAFVTSTGVIDSPSNAFIRKALMEENQLISTIRLPENLFENTAGIQVQSDLIILQKNYGREKNLTKEERDFVKGDSFNRLNRVVHTKMDPSTNQFGKIEMRFSHQGGEEGIAKDLRQMLKEDFKQNYKENLYYGENQETKQEILSEKKEKRSRTTLKINQPQQLSLFNNFASFVETQQLSLFDDPAALVTEAPKEMPVIDKEFIRYDELKIVYYNLKDSELENKTEHPELRQKLNEIYDKFIDNFGVLNLNRNEKILKDDGFKEIQSIENLKEKIYVKSDIFYEPTSFRNKEVEYTVQDALDACLNEFNTVNVDYIVDLANVDRLTVLEELNGDIYYNPIEDNYELADLFLSGNIIDKLEKIEAISVSEEYREEYNEAVTALVKVIPKTIPLSEIGINFGERWIPVSYFHEFSKYLFNSPATADRDKAGVHITYNSNLDDFFCENYNGTSSVAKQFSVQTYNRYYKPENVFRIALKDNIPNMTKKIVLAGKEVTVPDTAGIQKMNLAVDRIRNEFAKWLLTLPDVAKNKLESIYNRKFNNSVKAQHNGSFQKFPHLNYKGLGIDDLYLSQKGAIQLIKNNFGGLIDHEVGGGKTLIACIASYELKRLGKVNKPLITGIKANVADIAKTYKLAYPHAKVLYPNKEDFKSGNLDKLLAKIQNNNWDVIIMSHEQFAKIPQSYEVIKQISDEKISNLREAINNLNFEDEKEERRARKSLESKIENLEARLDRRAFEIEQTKSSGIVDFKTMGIDFITVDESHKFKNLEFETKHGRVAGLGSQNGSDRALNLLFALRTIQFRTEKDFGATFLSGTPISNSLTELYNICSYLRPQALKDQGLYSFDAWIATYAEKSKEFEFSVTNEIIQKERFRKFIKVPELASFYAEFTDYKTAEMIGVDRPKKNEILVELQKTPDQEMMFERLKEFAKRPDGELIYRDQLTNSEEKAKMLLATNVAKKASLDMRLIKPDFADHPDNKANGCVENVFKLYQSFDEHKGTQFIFSDLGTYKKDTGVWNIYTDIKDKLIAKGVSESEIQFIQTCTTEKARDELKANLNAGTVRVVLGSTEMLGTGINAQERVIGIHHLDIPWTPKDIEQRNGRGVRTGNWVAKQFNNNEVPVFIYAVKQTLDVYKFNLLATKQTFINQIKQQNISVRSIDEGAMDEKTGMGYNEYIAALSGDTTLLEKCKLEKQILVLKMEQKTFLSNLNDKNLFTEELAAKIKSNNQIINKLQSDSEKFAILPRDENGGIIFKVNLISPKIDADGNVTISFFDKTQCFEDKKEGGIALNTLIEAKIQDTFQGEIIGDFYGFNLRIKPIQAGTTLENKFYIDGEVTYTHNNGILPRTPELAAEFIIKALAKMESSLAKHKEDDLRLNKDLKDLTTMVDNGVFPKQNQLEAAEKELKNIIQTIEKNINSELEMTT